MYIYTFIYIYIYIYIIYKYKYIYFMYISVATGIATGSIAFVCKILYASENYGLPNMHWTLRWIKILQRLDS